MKKSISTAQTDANIKEIIQLLKAAPERLAAASKGLSPQQLHAPLRENERSFHETLAHLMHVEAVASQAILLALMLEEPVIPDIHAERDLRKLLQLNQLTSAELMKYFQLRRTILLHVLDALDAAGWSRCIRQNGKQRKESVYWRARALALHELEHIQDLELKVKK